jgi:glycosyltransferase involved in cell wall biosynthesis
MPAYNVADYLGQAIESVLVQTFADLELLVVDDGSTDCSAGIAKQFARRDARVRLLRQENGGISSARNLALRVAAGQLIAILDGDDCWDPAYLEQQVRILDRHPEISIVTGNAWFLGGRDDGRPARPFPDSRPQPDLAVLLDDEMAVFIMCTFRREVYETIGGFDETLRTNEDYDYWLRAALAGFRFYRNDTPLGRYRRRGDSLSADNQRMLTGAIRVLEKTRRELADKPRERRILDRKLGEFETNLLAEQARLAIQAADFQAATRHIAELRKRRRGLKLELAWMMARWAPGLLARAYHVRRGLQGVPQ